MRKKIEKMSAAEKAAIEAALSAVLKNVDNKADTFIDTFLTQREHLVVGRRILIANLILNGSTQMEINNTLGVSPNTYTKVRRWISGDSPSFEVSNEIDRERGQKPSSTVERSGPISFESLRKKYKTHYLLFTLSEHLLKKLKSDS